MLAVQAESRPSCAHLGQSGAAVPAHPWKDETPIPTRTVIAVTVFCEIRIPIPGLGGRGNADGDAARAGKAATVRICTPTSRRCKAKF